MYVHFWVLPDFAKPSVTAILFLDFFVVVVMGEVPLSTLVEMA